MTKPKFTPDPPPHLQGMPVEQAFPVFVDWAIRQEYRQEDWWPKDLEARVQALELLAPYCTGTWTIADAGYVDFGYEVVQPIGDCETSTGWDAGSSQCLTSAVAIDYSDTLGYIAMSGQPFQFEGRGLIVVDEPTGNIVFSKTNCNRTGHLICSTPGTSDRKLLAYIDWPCGSTGNRTLLWYDMDDSFSYLGSTNLGSFNCAITAERDDDILISSSFGRWNVVDKSTRALTEVTLTGSYVPGWAAAINPVGGTPDRYLTCNTSGSSWRFAVYQSGTSLTADTSPSVALGSIGGETANELKGRPVVVGSSVWWLFSVLESNKAYLVETDFSGNQLQAVPQFDTNNYNNTRSGHNQIYYESSNNSIYYMYGETLWRYSLTDEEYYTCDAPIDSMFTIIGDGRSSSLIRVNGYQWNMIIKYQLTKWGYEKIGASF